MSLSRRFAIAFIVAAAVFAVFAWPLPRYLTVGIPSSAANIEIGNVRAMIPGDHLQFLYQKWLAMDTFLGRTPWFHNPYEFNTGNDSDRKGWSTYYLPFSLFYTVGALVGDRALGWNLSILITFGLSYFFLWLLLRRFISDEFVAALLALLAVIVPYPWIAICGGSPTGFAMMWVPVVMYGLDRWIAEKSAAGAAWAGGAIFFSGWSDTHVFFFTTIIALPWCLVVYLARHGVVRPNRGDVVGWLRAAWPLMIFVGLIFLQAFSVRSGLKSTNVAAGRETREIALYSYSLEGLWALNRQGDYRKTYIGIYGLVLLSISFVVSVLRLARDAKDKRAWALLTAVGCVVGIFFLACGPKNPLGPRFWSQFVKFAPPFSMLRQPDKIFCLIPTFLGIIGALACPLGVRGARGLVRGVAAIVLFPLVLDYSRRVNVTICLIDREQGAYRAVSEDSRAKGEDARIVVLPLWPGDSHYASVYEYYVSLYRIRMVNGYRPSVRQEYRQQIFERFESMNYGSPSDSQLDDLLSRGVHYIVLHEDLFPEKVSSFPVGATLTNLLSHPRLELLARDGAVWSFRIRPTPGEPTRASARAAVPVLFPVRLWDWGRSGVPTIAVKRDDSAIGSRFIDVPASGLREITSNILRATAGWPLEWHVRLRGQGHLVFCARADDSAWVEAAKVDSPSWTWLRIRSPPVRAEASLALTAKPEDGFLHLDTAFLTTAGWPHWGPGDLLNIPAVAFFHAGCTTSELDGVELRRRNDPHGEIFYSRHLYLEAGEYEIKLMFDSPALPGTELGWLCVQFYRPRESQASAVVRAGQPVVLKYFHPDNAFFRISFDYNRADDLIIRHVVVKRVK